MVFQNYKAKFLTNKFCRCSQYTTYEFTNKINSLNRSWCGVLNNNKTQALNAPYETISQVDIAEATI